MAISPGSPPFFMTMSFTALQSPFPRYWRRDYGQKLNGQGGFVPNGAFIIRGETGRSRARLAAKGIPYILATGGHIEPPPAEHASAPVLSKPFTLDAIEPAIERAIAG